ncbi:MAG: DUF350 domain-containing protein [Alphaproteobacteria bacterium]|nr:DUF350 domain-containing protein [Alphaproteobacteria bacterium]
MLQAKLDYLVTLPDFALFLVCAVLLYGAFLFAYTTLTPHREWALIRDGNAAAAISLVGASVGFTLPLASAIINSLSILDMVVWGVVALLVQLLAFILARIIFPNLVEAIERGSVAQAVAVGGMSLCIGILNAACMTY